MKGLVYAAAALVLLSGTSSQADQTAVPFGYGDPTDGATRSFTVQQFNPSLGTLTSITFSLGFGTTDTVFLQNNDTTPSSGSVQTVVQFTIQDTGSDLNLAATASGSGDFSFQGEVTDGGTFFNPHTTTIVDPSTTGHWIFNSPTLLSEFTGTGLLTLSESAPRQTTLTSTSPDTIITSEQTTASVSGSVTYTYVPEPASAGLFGLGLLLLASRRRAANTILP